MRIKEETRMVTVTDDWHPCYPNNQIELTIMLCCYKTKYWLKINALGMDDYGKEVCMIATDLEDGLTKYSELKKLYDSVPERTNRWWFEEHGFIDF